MSVKYRLFAITICAVLPKIQGHGTKKAHPRNGLDGSASRISLGANEHGDDSETTNENTAVINIILWMFLHPYINMASFDKNKRGMQVFLACPVFFICYSLPYHA